MAVSRRALLLSLLVVAVAVAPRMSKATTEEATPQASSEAPKPGHVFKPSTENAMYDDNAQANSPIRQFWDNQTRQSMDANIAIEKGRRKDQGWDQEGGHVLKAMEDIKNSRKSGEDVDAEDLKNEAHAALAKILRKTKKGTTNSLQDLKKEEAEEDKRLASKSGVADEFLKAQELQRKQQEADRAMRQRQHIEDLKSQGNFFRKHPNDGS